MQEIGKLLIILGIIAITVGLIFVFGAKIPFLGKLPGDILIKKEGFTFYAPVTSGIIISIVLSLIMFIVSKLRQ